MRANSKQVTTNQKGLHPRLVRVVENHLGSMYQKPISRHGRAAYQQLSEQLNASQAPLVLDSFCGTGHSTAQLARRFPRHLVIGVDKSAHRLARKPVDIGENAILLQADCEDIWQQLVADGRQVEHHFLLYPNPWPKAKHLQRRVHGHGSLPLLLQLGGTITLRSNWQLYVEEFGVALHLAGRYGVVSEIEHGEPISPFERKYRDSGHTIWQYRSAKLEK